MNDMSTLIRQRSFRLFVMLLAAILLPHCDSKNKTAYLEAGIAAGEWISMHEIELDTGLAWPIDPEDERKVDYSLYSGTPGPILYFLHAYRYTGDVNYLIKARKGGDHLLTELSLEQPGLYVGLSGQGFVLEELHKTSGERKYRDGVLQILSLLEQNAQEAGEGVQWGETTDIISGNAGIGLFLLWAAPELEEPKWVELASRAADRLIEVSKPGGVGRKWAMNDEFPRLMPNFSHGTAGIAYFLATLYEKSGDKKYLDAALEGAEYLKAIANTSDDEYRIFHHEPEGEDLYYLGYCHGPVGTSRLFFRLYLVTGDAEWLNWVEKGANAIMKSGIPENETEGFWNNVGQCCGSAGIAQHFLNLYNITEEVVYLDFAKKLTDSLLGKSTEDGQGLKWIQAEHRRRPEFLVAQTGYMQGAAGIGILLINMDAVINDVEPPRLFFPDSPF